MDNAIGKSIIVSGRVQGVFYRASTLARAQELKLKGWVKNLPNGDVQIEVFGDQAVVDQLISWCAQGPPAANVSHVEAENIPFREEEDFRVTY